MKTLTGIFFAIGIMVAGSEGPLFPWINFLGLAIFLLSVVMISKAFGDNHEM